jgi:hypothetical protein
MPSASPGAHQETARRQGCDLGRCAPLVTRLPSMPWDFSAAQPPLCNTRSPIICGTPVGRRPCQCLRAMDRAVCFPCYPPAGFSFRGRPRLLQSSHLPQMSSTNGIKPAFGVVLGDGSMASRRDYRCKTIKIQRRREEQQLKRQRVCTLRLPALVQSPSSRALCSSGTAWAWLLVLRL